MSRFEPLAPALASTGARPGLQLGPEVLGRLMPMFLWLDRRGRIKAMGPTLTKIVGAQAQGTAFARHFTLRRARGMADAGQGPVASGSPPPGGGRRLGLSLVRHPAFNLRGTALELPAPEAVDTAGAGRGVEGGGVEGGDVLLNLSFGIQLAEAVGFFGLTEADFAASDLAMEFLFLTEAKAAVLAELGALTGRLDTARREALSEALSDPLTGLANRRAFDAALERAAAGLESGHRNFALLHLDLDFFKKVNDTLGHAAGDAVLVHAAKVLRDEVRRGDLVGRLGGDEFMILLRGPVDAPMLEALSERLIARLEDPVMVEGQPCRVSASIGCVIATECAPCDLERLLAAADGALYASKRSGRGRWSVAQA